MNSLLSNIRFWVLLFTVFLSAAIFIFVPLFYQRFAQGVLRTTEIYAFVSLAYLYVALTIGPATKILTFLPNRGQILKARRAIGVSAFYFATLHALMAFINIVGSFEGFFALPLISRAAVLMGLTSLLILLCMALTSFDSMVTKLTFPRWKFLHRFVYLAGVLIVIHATLLGNHFSDPREAWVKYITYIMVTFLVLFHLYGLYLKRKQQQATSVPQSVS
jgi:methionine sulfoxide reductase heme-binding subunit